MEKSNSKFGDFGDFWDRENEDWWKLSVLRYVPVGCGKGECVEVEDYLKSGEEYRKTGGR